MKVFALHQGIIFRIGPDHKHTKVEIVTIDPNLFPTLHVLYFSFPTSLKDRNQFSGFVSHNCYIIRSTRSRAAL